MASRVISTVFEKCCSCKVQVRNLSKTEKWGCTQVSVHWQSQCLSARFSLEANRLNYCTFYRISSFSSFSLKKKKIGRRVTGEQLPNHHCFMSSNKLHIFYKNTHKSTFLSLYRNFSVSPLPVQHICTPPVPMSHQLLLSK